MVKPIDNATMIKVLRDYFENQKVPYLERSKTWNILSALRGPDSGNDAQKMAITAVIRYKALGSLIRENFFGFSHPDSQKFVEERLQQEKIFENRVRDGSSLHGHFLAHAKDAFHALGLDFLKENKDEE